MKYCVCSVLFIYLVIISNGVYFRIQGHNQFEHGFLDRFTKVTFPECKEKCDARRSCASVTYIKRYWLCDLFDDRWTEQQTVKYEVKIHCKVHHL